MRGIVRLALAAGWVLAAGCGDSATSPRAPGSVAAGVAARRRGPVAVSFEAKRPGGKALPFAFVEGRVAGQPTRFVLDTGATAHVIDASLALASNVATSPRGSHLAIDGWGALPAATVLVRELSPTLRAHGIGGIVAPQLLVESEEAVVLDLVNRQLQKRPRSAAWSELSELGPALTAASAKPCRTEVDGAPRTALVVDAALDGVATRLALDTGASRTVVVEGASPAGPIAARPVLGRTVAAMASGDLATTLHGGVPLAAGAWSATADVGLAPRERPALCGEEGRLGLDVLQRCALAFTEGEFLVACRAPAR
jgi:predicted aspartyl protease